jgi:hypothetical protein
MRRMYACEFRQFQQGRHRRRIFVKAFDYPYQPLGYAPETRLSLPAGMRDQFEYHRLQRQIRCGIGLRELTFNPMLQSPRVGQTYETMIGHQMPDRRIGGEGVIEVYVETARSAFGEAVGVLVACRMHQQQTLLAITGLTASQLQVTSARH